MPTPRTTCPRCGAPVVYKPLADGTPIPLDNLVTVYDEDSRSVVKRWVTHGWTCEHRQRRQGRAGR